MLRSTALVFLFLLLTGCAVSLRSHPADDLVALEHRWVEAIRSHDVAQLDALLDESFVDSTFRGATRTKEQVLSGPPAGGRYHSIRLDDLAVRRYGSTGIVTGVNVLQGAGAGDTVRVRFTDVFVKRRGRWRAVCAQETLQTTP